MFSQFRSAEPFQRAIQAKLPAHLGPQIDDNGTHSDHIIGLEHAHDELREDRVDRWMVAPCLLVRAQASGHKLAPAMVGFRLPPVTAGDVALRGDA